MRTYDPVEFEYLGGQWKVNIERPRGLEKNTAAPCGGSSYLTEMYNYQSRLTDPAYEENREAART